MSPATPELPRFGITAAALRRTTEHLAREVATPGTMRPDWNEFEWDVARAVAAMQGITVLLAHRLRWQGPPRWQAFLESQRRLALQREARIDALIARIDATLHLAGVCAVGLKGTALRALELYRPGERPMGDIDLLIRGCDADRAARAMQAVEYVPAFESRRHRVFEPRARATIHECGEHPDNPLKIELHQTIAEALPARLVNISGCLLTGDLRPGVNPYPATVELLRHLLLHAAGNMRAHALRQLQLHDIALLATRLDSADWSQLLGTSELHGGAWWMWPVLALTERYFPCSLPPGIVAFRAISPRMLRTVMTRTTLTDVSWSNLRIAALPGLCWSRSAYDVLRLIRSRLIPERIALDELRCLNKTMPALMRQPWYGISHPRRIVKWVFSRPPRVHTMVSLRAALRHGHAER